ncbi:MAG: hypothetical protein K2G90_04245, partial [Muribaculaceae bacterium]|nr:hypothetical protein [Muribaculaceae bacterium]
MFKTPIRNIFKAAFVAALLLFSPSMGSASAASAPVVKKSAANNKSRKVTSKMSKAENTFANPDFAFPQTVERNARPVSEKAIKNKDGME